MEWPNKSANQERGPKVANTRSRGPHPRMGETVMVGNWGRLTCLTGGKTIKGERKVRKAGGPLGHL